MVYREKWIDYLRKDNEVTVEIDLKSPIQHCLQKDEEKFNENIRVLSLILNH